MTRYTRAHLEKGEACYSVKVIGKDNLHLAIGDQQQFKESKRKNTGKIYRIKGIAERNAIVNESVVAAV